MTEGHTVVHLLDGAAEAAAVPQWRQQRLRPCPLRWYGAQCRATISWPGSVYFLDGWEAAVEVTVIPTSWTCWAVEGVVKRVRGQGRG